MIRCPFCQSLYKASATRCAACDRGPERVDGRVAWAPQLAFANDGFDPGYFADLAPLEADNFWFRARNDLIIWALRRYFGAPRSFLEVGCGTGFVLAGVSRSWPQARLVGSEIYSAGLEFAAQRVKDAEFVQLDARSIPYEEEFDVVGAFDVLEHIEDDEAVLAGLRRATRPGGGVLLSVPQHPSLWSATDEYAHHVRRYTAQELEQKVRRAGLEILRSTSFVTLLLPAMLASRHLHRDLETYDPLAEMRISSSVNRVLGVVMALERLAIRAGFSLPVGGSRLVVARRPVG